MVACLTDCPAEFSILEVGAVDGQRLGNTDKVFQTLET